MLSVLLIDSKIFDHYNRYDYFWDHFENNGDFAVCVWNKECSDGDISAMIPQLMDKIRNVPEWNAYVICEPHRSIDYLQKDFENKTQYSVNPYERANKDDYDIEKDPLLKLVYFLGGRGDNSVGYIQQYQFRAARPNNIYLFTPRLLKNIQQQKLFLLSDLRDTYKGPANDPAKILSGEIDITKQYSEFWERYEYPANCRFMVYDFPEENHLTYQDSWFQFWIAIVSMTQNRFTNAVLAPYKLHIIDIEVNDDKFSDYINKFYTMLLENKEINRLEIEEEIRLEKLEASATDITVGDSVTPVYVNFPHFSVETLFADTGNIGLVKDVPVLDEDDWFHQMRRTREAIGNFFKSIGRGKNEAVDSVCNTLEAELPQLRDKRITKYDKEELQEAMNQDELNMLELDTGYTASRAEFEKKQHKASKIIEKYMQRRLRKKVSIILLACCMLVYFVGFVPFLINSFTFSTTSFLIALLISVLALVIPLVCGIIQLYRLKKELKSFIEEYNQTVIECYETARKGSEIQGEYLTYLLDYMKKNELFTHAKSENRHSKRIDQLTIANAVFDDAILECSALASLRHLKLSRITDRYVANTIEITPGAHIYLYEENIDGKMALNDTPDILTAPFSFTDHFSVISEELYECINYKKCKENE